MKPSPTVTSVMEQWEANIILVALPVLGAALLGLHILMAFYRHRQKANTFFNPLYANLVLLALVCICVARPTTVYQIFFGCDLSALCRVLHVFFLGVERAGIPLAVAMLLLERAWFFRSSSGIVSRDQEQLMTLYFRRLTRCEKVLMVVPWVVSISGSVVMTYFLQNPPGYLSSQQVNETYLLKNSTAQLSGQQVNETYLSLGQIQWDCVLPAAQKGAAVYLVISFWVLVLLLGLILPGIYFGYALYDNYRGEQDWERQGTTLQGNIKNPTEHEGCYLSDIRAHEQCETSERRVHDDIDTSDSRVHGDTDTSDSRAHDDIDTSDSRVNDDIDTSDSRVHGDTDSRDAEMGNTKKRKEGKTIMSLYITGGVAVLCLIVTVTSLVLTVYNGWLDELTQCAYFVLEMVLVLSACAFPEIRHTMHRGSWCSSFWHHTQILP